MWTYAERRSFMAHDSDGRQYLLVANLPPADAAAAARAENWTYRTLDGRTVRREPGCQLDTVEAGDIRLTTSDRDEPPGRPCL